MGQFDSSRRRFLGTAAAIGAAGLTTSFVSIARAQGTRVLNARASRDIVNLDPGYMVGTYDAQVQNAVMPRLVDFTVDGGSLGWRPTVYTSSIVETDPTHIDFTLNAGFTWTNGFGELTAEDVKYSFERMKVSDYKGDWEVLDHVSIKDRYSGTIVLKHPFKPFWSIALAGTSGLLVCMKATESVGGKYTTEIPAVCGPYLYSWEPGRNVAFTRNPDWSGPKPHFDAVNQLLIKEDNAADLAFEAGETDISHAEGSTLVRYRTSPPPNSNIYVAGSLRYAWIGMNTEHPKLQDIRVRRAVQHAIDVDAILAGALPGAERAYGVVPPGVLGKRDTTQIDYNPEKAKALLSEAGASGLELDLRTRNRHERVLACQIVQANLAAVGVTVNVISMESAAFNDAHRESKGDGYKDSQLWYQRFRGAEDPSEQLQWFVRDQVGNWNWERWADDEFENLYQTGLAESDPGRRHRHYVRMQEIMEDTGAYVWLGHQSSAFVHRASVQPHISITGQARFPQFREA